MYEILLRICALYLYSVFAPHTDTSSDAPWTLSRRWRWKPSRLLARCPARFAGAQIRARMRLESRAKRSLSLQRCPYMRVRSIYFVLRAFELEWPVLCMQYVLAVRTPCSAVLLLVHCSRHLSARPAASAPSSMLTRTPLHERPFYFLFPESGEWFVCYLRWLRANVSSIAPLMPRPLRLPGSLSGEGHKNSISPPH